MDETAFKALISGERRGVIPGLQRAGLSALALGYELAVRVRNRAFDLGLKRSHEVGVPVVSVGNITTGGTGKTPLVAFLVRWFQSRGLLPAILSRGYRSLDGQANDEKLVLDRLCPGVPHLQQPDRVASAKTAIAEHAAQLLILDDGFQHRRLRRDLDIVLIDAMNPFGYGRVLPRGLLREPLSGLKRADVLVLTRADQCDAAAKSEILATLRHCAPKTPIIEVAFRASELISITGETQPLSSIDAKPVVAFCGIGNPESFRKTLGDCDLREFRPFPDHYHYTDHDIRELAKLADAHEAALVTTLKDLVKINPAAAPDHTISAAQISAEILSGAAELDSCLQSVLTSM